MANIDPVVLSYGDGFLVKWENIQPGDTIIPVRLNGYGAMAACLQIDGTFGGATTGFQGSNDNVDYFNLTNLAGAAIALTAAGLVDLSTGALFLRPAITGGAAYAINYYLMARS